MEISTIVAGDDRAPEGFLLGVAGRARAQRSRSIGAVVLTTIYIDADACPVKDEVYRVAKRYEIKVFVVSNSPMRVPKDERIEAVEVRGGFDVADDWIVEHVEPDDIVITTDIPLAESLPPQGGESPRSQRA